MLGLFFTDRAELHLEELSGWWAVNRPDSRRQVIEIVEEVTLLLREVSGMGSFYARKRGREVRKLRVGKTPYYLYYSVDKKAEMVAVLAIWSRVRRASPPI